MPCLCTTLYHNVVCMSSIFQMHGTLESNTSGASGASELAFLCILIFLFISLISIKRLRKPHLQLARRYEKDYKNTFWMALASCKSRLARAALSVFAGASVNAMMLLHQQMVG